MVFYGIIGDHFVPNGRGFFRVLIDRDPAGRIYIQKSNRLKKFVQERSMWVEQVCANI
jgi:hypothetical protein